jgi:hypothetical protein
MNNLIDVMIKALSKALNEYIWSEKVNLDFCAFLKQNSHAIQASLLALTSTQFPPHIHEAVQQKLPWTKLLDSADGVDGNPMEAVAKAYIKAIATCKGDN